MSTTFEMLDVYGSIAATSHKLYDITKKKWTGGRLQERILNENTSIQPAVAQFTIRYFKKIGLILPQSGFTRKKPIYKYNSEYTTPNDVLFKDIQSKYAMYGGSKGSFDALFIGDNRVIKDAEKQVEVKTDKKTPKVENVVEHEANKIEQQQKRDIKVLAEMFSTVCNTREATAFFLDDLYHEKKPDYTLFECLAEYFSFINSDILAMHIDREIKSGGYVAYRCLLKNCATEFIKNGYDEGEAYVSMHEISNENGYSSLLNEWADDGLVDELRNRGYTVQATKTITL